MTPRRDSTDRDDAGSAGQAEVRGHLRVAVDAVEGCVETDLFRAIMGALPSGVTVVTTVDPDGRPLGLTCSAACSVSMDPPLLLVCIHSESQVLKAILHRERFVLNVLREQRESLSSLFASKRADRFGSVAWQASASGLPWLPADTVSHAECQLTAAVEAGDHTVLIGAIVDGSAPDADNGPLMYWRRRYGRWPVEDDAVAVALTMATEG